VSGAGPGRGGAGPVVASITSGTRRDPGAQASMHLGNRPGISPRPVAPSRCRGPLQRWPPLLSSLPGLAGPPVRPGTRVLTPS
jgi:hypothetical protein